MQKYFFLLFLVGVMGLKACVSPFGLTQAPNTAPTGNNPFAKSSNVDNRRMTCQHHVLSLRDSLKITLQIFIPRLEKSTTTAEFIKNFSVNYGILPDYNSQNFLSTKTIDLAQAQLVKQGVLFYLMVQIPKKPDVSEVMLLEFMDNTNGKRLVHDLPLVYVTAKFREVYGLFDVKSKLPRLSHYLTTQDTIQIASWQHTLPKKLWVKHYTTDFQNATTPMATANQGGIPKNLAIDSVFQVESHTPFQFKKAGLYAIAEDTTTYYSLSFWVDKNEKYPKYTSPQELVKPLIYISLEEEMRKLTQSDQTKDSKKELDRYWLKLMQGNTNKAKLVIKEFYNRVRLANQLFTTFKEGWKTDMGMILIIFGMPNRITKAKDKQLWSYTQNPNFSEINFTFIQKPNQFTDNHYVLVRYPEYEQIWYPTIELWREGKLAVGY